jgi:hypothetical protein
VPRRGFRFLGRVTAIGADDGEPDRGQLHA